MAITDRELAGLWVEEPRRATYQVGEPSPYPWAKAEIRVWDDDAFVFGDEVGEAPVGVANRASYYSVQDESIFDIASGDVELPHGIVLDPGRVEYGTLDLGEAGVLDGVLRFTVPGADGGEDVVFLTPFGTRDRLNGVADPIFTAVTPPEDLSWSSYLVAPAAGTAGDDTVTGTRGRDRLFGFDGDDLLVGGGGKDTVFGGAGRDTLDLSQERSAGRTVVLHTGEEDHLRWNLVSPRNWIDAVGVEEVIGTRLSDNIHGYHRGAPNEQAADVRLDGRGGDDFLYGQGPSDVLLGRGGDDYLSGGGELSGGGGADRLYMSLWHSSSPTDLWGGAGADSLMGGGQADRLGGGTDADVMHGHRGDDIYWVDNAGDRTREERGEGRDEVRTSVSHALGYDLEVLVLRGSGDIDGRGNTRDNAITGNGGRNRLLGGEGEDELLGGHGGDRLSGGVGQDRLTGGAGRDRFAFDQLAGEADADEVTDFEAGVDRILLGNWALSAVGPEGALAAERLALDEATTAEHRVVHRQATGELLYDADGVGGEAALRIGWVGAGIALSAEDFLVI